MCGIAGWIDQTRDMREEKETLSRMMASMLHRGPDDHHHYLTSCCALLHARLSVMDPARGKQPMHYRQYVIVYNGELYNTKEIKAELENYGYCFETACDTEVLIKAYDYWKEECVHRFNGIFAFVIWDKEKQRAFMARDRLGVKPLFYFKYETGFIFASEIKTLLKNPLVKPIVRQEGLQEIFLLGPARTSGKTPIDKLYELKPGECATYYQNTFLKKQYWKLKAKKHTETIEETIKHLKKLVEESVQIQLDSDVGLCTFLSGGLDSSIISKIASRRYKNLDTFSIEYEENDKYFKKSIFQPNRDEEFIDSMVEDCKSNHHRVVFSQKEVVEALFTSTKARDLPGMAEVDSSLLLFCKEIKKHHSVAISGEGADEILGGYPWYYNEGFLWEEGFPWAPSIESRLFCIKDGLLDNPKKYIKDAYQKTIAEVDCLEKEEKKQKRMREMFYLNIQWFLQTLLERKDRMSMYSGVEVRVPFLDYRLVEYAYNMPWEYKAMHGREKGILREAFKNDLPDAIVLRKKSPYPKSHHPKYTQMLVKKIREVMKQDSVLSKVLDEKKLEIFIKNVDSMELPWYGQLMKGPQVLAYFLQIHYFFEENNIQLDIT